MNIDAMQRDLATKKAAIESMLTKQMTEAETEKRERTDAEKKSVEDLMVEARALKARIDRAQGDAQLMAEIQKLSQGIGPTVTPEARTVLKSYGEQWVTSDAFKFFKDGGHRTAGSWRSPSQELWTPSQQLGATTLSEDAGSGGKLIVPQYLPGIMPVLTRRVVVADLIAPGTTDSTSIIYMVETTFTNAATPVAEGAAKPESTLVFDQKTETVSKIAHWLPVTEEMLEDVSQIRSYIDARLRTGLDLTEEDQVLSGNGTPPNLMGLRNRTGLATAVARGADTNPDAIFKQISAIATNALIQPDGFTINPANWQTIQLMKDNNGQYYGSGPFAAPQAPRLWGLPGAVTPAQASGEAFVGAFQQAAQIFRKGGVRVEASNSHNDYFVKNLVAIRAEERLGLAVYRPAAFGKVTGLS